MAVVAELDGEPAVARAMVMATDDYTIGHVFRSTRLGAGAGLASEEERARMDDLLATVEFPLLAGMLAAGGDFAPPEPTFETGLELLFDGMQAMLDARRG